jgi:TPM domain
MPSLNRVGISFLLVLSWMWIYRLPDGSALAEVKDDTSLFTTSALQQADQITRQFKQKYGKEMLVEVFAEIPADLRSQYSADRKDQFFSQWTLRRMQEIKANGVYVLVCRNPSHLQANAGNDTRQRAFTQQNLQQLKNIMLSQFQNKQYDQGLLDGVNYVDRTFAANLGNAGTASSANPEYHYQAPSGGGSAGATPNPPPTGSGLHWIWWVLLIGIAIFIINRFLRSRAPGSTMYTQRDGGGSPPGNYPPGGYPGNYPQQGGGFGRGIMGGLLGGVAGGWLYDKLGHRNEGSGYTPPPSGSGFSGPSVGDDASAGYSGPGAGGDFGGGSGSDFGGGGGGDSGGGGGDMGGGGGDAGGGAGGDF